jgi:phage-related protein
MSTSGELYTQDHVVAQVAGSLADQIASMKQSASTIQGIVSDVETYFVSAASGVFGQAMDDWNTKYGQIISQYDTWLQDYQTGHEGINNAHSDALSIAGKVGGGGGDVYSALSGN